LITVTSSANFTMWDNVTCIFGGNSVTGVIVPPLAYCTVPPYYTYLVFQPFTLLVNGTSKITSRLLYSYSNMLPTSSTQLSSFLWTTGTARTINYNTTNVFSLGNSTVAVHLYQWNFDPFDINVPTPVLVDLGVITSCPFNLATTLTTSTSPSTPALLPPNAPTLGKTSLMSEILGDSHNHVHPAP